MGYVVGILAFAWIAYTLNGILERLRELQRSVSDLAVPSRKAMWEGIKQEEKKEREGFEREERTARIRAEQQAVRGSTHDA